MAFYILDGSWRVVETDPATFYDFFNRKYPFRKILSSEPISGGRRVITHFLGRPLSPGKFFITGTYHSEYQKPVDARWFATWAEAKQHQENEVKQQLSEQELLDGEIQKAK